MNWNPTEWKTDCGRYEITKIDDKNFWLQVLKPFSKTGWARNHVGTFNTLEEAQQAAAKGKDQKK